MQKRSIIGMIVFTIITLGIYEIYWYCSFQNQLKNNTGMGFGGLAHFLMSMVTFGIYGLYWSFAVGKRIKALGGKDNGVLYLILSLFGFFWIANLLMQHEVNKINS